MAPSGASAQVAPAITRQLVPFLAGYFFISGGLTIYNKWLIADVGFDCPVLLICLTYSINFAIAAALRSLSRRRGWRLSNGSGDGGGGSGSGAEVYQALPPRRWVTMIPIGVCAGLEVASSNLALLTLDVAFHTMIKAATPIFVLFFAVVLRIQALSLGLVAVVLLVCGGVAVLSAGESGGAAFSSVGLCFTLASCALSGLRWALSQLLMQGRKGRPGQHGSGGRDRVNPLTLLYYMSPFSVLALLPVSLAMEWDAATLLFSALTAAALFRMAVLVTCCATLAFGLVIVEFSIVQRASSLTLCMVGVLKELVLVITAVVLLGNTLPGVSILGFMLTLAGVIGYHELMHRGGQAAGGGGEAAAAIAGDIPTEAASPALDRNGEVEAGQDMYAAGKGSGRGGDGGWNGAPTVIIPMSIRTGTGTGLGPGGASAGSGNGPAAGRSSRGNGEVEAFLAATGAPVSVPVVHRWQTYQRISDDQSELANAEP